MRTKKWSWLDFDLGQLKRNWILETATTAEAAKQFSQISHTFSLIYCFINCCCFSLDLVWLPMTRQTASLGAKSRKVKQKDVCYKAKESQTIEKATKKI